MTSRCEWERGKAHGNGLKQRVSVATALWVFADRFRRSAQDRIEAGGPRRQTIGSVAGQVMILIAHTVRRTRTEKSSVSSRLARAIRRRNDAMRKIGKRKVDMSKRPRLSAKQKAELKGLAVAPHEQIEHGDIAPLSNEFWKVAERGRFYKPIKKSTTVRVDADVLAWLKSQGKGYQTRINSILRNAMLRALGGRRSVR